MKKVTVILFILLVHFWSYAQDDELITLQIDSIQILAKSSPKSIFENKINLRSDNSVQQQFQSLPDLLQSETGIYIKNYGPGSLSTFSIRGGNASQSQVLWNNIPIHSPMLGLTDLALLPVQLSQSIDFSQGGSSAIRGSGAITGAINFTSIPKFNQRNEITFGLKSGSFGLNNRTVNIQSSSNAFSLRAYHSNEKRNNNYPFILSNGSTKKLKNAAYSIENNLVEAFSKISANSILSFHFWNQKAERAIPPTTTQNNSIANQSDQANRLLIQFKKNSDHVSLESKIAYLIEDQTYEDNAINISSNNKFNSIYLESGIRSYWFNNQTSFLGLALSSNKAKSTNYIDQKEEQIFSAFITHRLTYKNFNISLEAREEIVDKNFIPFIPSLHISWVKNNWLDIGLKANRNYRRATLNDKYWNPGGDIDLKAENGWNYEALINMDLNQNEDINAKFNLTIYNRNINNWILWHLEEGNNFFSPTNLAEVWSRGIESKFDLMIQKNKNIFDLTLGYNFTKSTNQKTISNPRIEKGAQLLYTPEHIAFMKTSYSIENFNITLDHRFVGTSFGINDNIESFIIGDLSLAYNIYSQSSTPSQTTLCIQINNLWNQNYRVVERRPMPGRNFEFSINHNITN